MSTENTESPVIRTFPYPGTTLLTLNRPSRCNCFSDKLLDLMIENLDWVEKDADHPILMIRGAGGVFCSGLDLKEAFTSGEKARFMAEKVLKILYRIRTSSKIVVVLAQKAACGGGGGIVSVSDYVIASEDFRIGFPELRRGLAPALLHPFLKRKLTPTALSRLVLTALPIDAKTAQNFQLVQQIVPAQDLISAGEKIASEIFKGDPLLFASSKREIIEPLVPTPEELQSALDEHWRSWCSDRAREGILSFIEKRAPQWLAVNN